MAKKVFYDDDARTRVLGGAQALYDAVKVTMGPKGRNVVIAKSYGNPTVTHDGVTVAEGVELDESDEAILGYKVGADLIKQAAKKMNKAAGDGTTTVTVLTYHILREANRMIAAGHNPMELRKGVESAAKDVLSALQGHVEAIEGDSGRIAEVATISAGDAAIGKLIADVVSKIGSDGVVTVEEGQGLEMESEVVEGFTFDRGYISPYMVTDTARLEAVYEKPAIIITDKKVSSVQEFLPILEKLAQAGKKDVVLVAEDVDGEALGILILNKLKGTFNTVAVKAPSFGDRRKDILGDIATLTGATVISDEQGLTFENIDLGVVGTARKVIVSKDSTTIIEGAGKDAAVEERLRTIVAQADNAASEYDKEQLDKRRAALSGKVAVIKVGGASETEIEEKKFRVDDAVAATKAALSEGIVAGGGVTLVNLAGVIDAGVQIETDGAKEKLLENIQIGLSRASYAAGRQILKDALSQPFKQLMLNAGKNADALLAKVQEAKTGHGVDVNDPTNKIVDLKKSGVVDPAAVTRQAIQNASSIAATAMTMGALIVDIPEKEAAGGAGGMGGGMPGMGMM